MGTGVDNALHHSGLEQEQFSVRQATASATADLMLGSADSSALAWADKSRNDQIADSHRRSSAATMASVRDPRVGAALPRATVTNTSRRSISPA